MKQKFNNSMLAVLMVLLMLVTVQCSSFVKTTYSSLGTAAVVYDTGMKTIAELHKAGKINDEVKEEAISIGNDYYDAYIAAVAALEIYQGMSKGDKEGQKMQIMEMMEKLSEIGARLTDIINKYK
jgi:hypothetical protein